MLMPNWSATSFKFNPFVRSLQTSVSREESESLRRRSLWLPPSFRLFSGARRENVDVGINHYLDLKALQQDGHSPSGAMLHRSSGRWNGRSV
jgi:hypothetical protein